MYKFKDKLVSVEQEIEAVAKYLATKWQDVPSVRGLVADIATWSSLDGRWYLDGYDAWLQLHDRQEARRELLKGVYPSHAAIAHSYDSSCLQMNFLRSAISFLEAHCRYAGCIPEFSTRAEAVFQRALSKYPGLERAHPAGWDPSSPEDTDGLAEEEYAKKQQSLDEANFGGGTAGGNSLPYEVSLPSVVHEGHRRKYSPGQVMVNAVYAHFLKFVSHRNSKAMEKALGSLQFQDTAPHLVWDVTLDSENPHLWVALRLSEHLFQRESQIVVYGEKGYTEALAALREFELLSDEEKTKAQAQSMSELDRMLMEQDTEESRQEEERIAAQDAIVLTSLLTQAEKLITPVVCI